MKRTHLLLSLAALALVSALRAEDKAGPKDNTPPAGFTALFNGKDLTNWQGLIELPQRAKLSAEQLAERQKKADEDMKAHWSAKDGILVFDGRGKSLQSAKDYGDFELYVDWKIGPKGDSGIYLRGQPQVQIWEPNSGGGSVVNGQFVGSGGLFNNKNNPSKPLKAADKAVGEWNTFHIIMKGDRVTVFLNGEKVVDDTPLENYFEKGKPLPATGPIELQNHGNPLYFKNIYVKDLSEQRSK
jgi:hypothetical protein